MLTDASVAAAANNNARMPISAEGAPSSPRPLALPSAGAEVADVKDVAAATSLRSRRVRSGRSGGARLDDRGRSCNDGVGMAGQEGRSAVAAEAGGGGSGGGDGRQ